MVWPVPIFFPGSSLSYTKNIITGHLVANSDINDEKHTLKKKYKYSVMIRRLVGKKSQHTKQNVGQINIRSSLKKFKNIRWTGLEIMNWISQGCLAMPFQD